MSHSDIHVLTFKNFFLFLSMLVQQHHPRSESERAVKDGGRGPGGHKKSQDKGELVNYYSLNYFQKCLQI